MTPVIPTKARLPNCVLAIRRPSTCDVLGVSALVVVLLSPQLLPGWVSMFVNCAAVFFWLKHWVWLAARRATRDATWGERLVFYALWPGFDADAFLVHPNHKGAAPAHHDWLAAAAKTALAVCFLWLLLPLVGNVNATILGIAGMLGGVLLIHCGVFHFVALGWRSAGRS